MNQSAAVLAFEKNQKVGTVRELLAFVGLPSKAAARELTASASKVFCGVKEVLDGLLLRAIEKRTQAEFVATRNEVFADYFATVLALSNLAKVIVPPTAIERMMWESFSELEADFRDHGLARFGAAARDQAIFTVWTLRKTQALAYKISTAPALAAELKARDEKLIMEYSFFSAWAQFHFDCLVASMRFDKAIHPEVLEEIRDGLRAAVNAYGLIGQGVDLREPSADPPTGPYVWDDEDQELMNSSMCEIEAESD